MAGCVFCSSMLLLRVGAVCAHVVRRRAPVVVQGEIAGVGLLGVLLAEFHQAAGPPGLEQAQHGVAAAFLVPALALVRSRGRVGALLGPGLAGGGPAGLSRDGLGLLG